MIVKINVLCGEDCRKLLHCHFADNTAHFKSFNRENLIAYIGDRCIKKSNIEKRQPTGQQQQEAATNPGAGGAGLRSQALK